MKLRTLEVWRDHFMTLSTPNNNPGYDKDHFQYVTKHVASFNELEDTGQFLDTPFTSSEISKGISNYVPQW